jgi:aerobic-type carbon monoxide dehydrogenase small subunit (CoxS/CutS family)
VSDRPTDVTVALQVNGSIRRATVEPRRLLSDFLRHDLGLTGTHVGCEGGMCGACTVILDGEPARSCLVFAVQAAGSEVETVESLGTPDDLDPLQESFHRNHGLQCGFCTPGILMAATACARRGDHLEYVIDEVLDGHLCSCTGYAGIRAAIRDAWASLTLDRSEIDRG